MARDHLFRVLAPNGRASGGGYRDKAAAEHLAMTKSRTESGVWTVKPFDPNGAVVARYENGKRVKG